MEIEESCHEKNTKQINNEDTQRKKINAGLA